MSGVKGRGDAPGPGDAADSSAPDALLAGVRELYANAAACRQRRLLVISDARDSGTALAARLLQSLGLKACWYTDRAGPDERVFGTAAFSLLGREVDALVFDAFAGFDPDAFGALSGCIRAPGLLLLVVPPLAEWPDFNDPQNRRISVAPFSAEQVSGRFLARLARILADDPAAMLVEAGRLTRRGVLPAPPPGPAGDAAALGPCLTVDQQQAVQALVRVATGHRRRPVVLNSDRGRGKSAAFGIAAAQLIEQGRRRLLVTAPRAQAIETVLEHAQRLTPDARACLRFVPPDELLRQQPPADLLLVDEAAAVPAPLLEGLLKRYPRIAFATTVHGYEGTGRGFAVRFTRVLDQHSNSWRSIHLTTPVRWAAHDPLEDSVFRLLALDAEPADDGCFPLDDQFELQRLDRDRLVADEHTLGELFGLLVQAHYRTRPLDLRHLLDGPNLAIYVLRAGGHIAATALVAAEGGFDAATADAVWAGRHRPHGHLLPETLAAHQGLRTAPLLRCARIMRITVHPALRRRGLGSRLVSGIAAQLEQGECDYLGTSFGATRDLLAFWRQLGWQPVRLSIQKGASSGSHSAVFIKPLTGAGAELLQSARARFFAQFPYQLADSLSTLEAGLAAGLLDRADDWAPQLDAGDALDLQAFAGEQRLAEVSIGSLWRLAVRSLMTGAAQARLDDTELTLLVARVLQHRDWSDTAACCGLSGRREALSALRAVVGKLLC